MKIGKAIEALERGETVSRVGWIDKKILQLHYSYLKWDNHTQKELILMTLTPDEIAAVYSPTQQDLLAIDWFIIE